jgi:putative transposase
MAQHSEFEDFDQIFRQLQQAPELPFSDLLRPERVVGALAALGITFRDRIYTPVTTLWMFLSQVLSADHSCQDAVARLMAWRVARGKPRCSTDTASYCEARKRLPKELLRQLTRDVAGEMEQRAEQEWLWKGRPVKIVDGCTAMMADTPTNQAAYPQNSEQKPGLGFPIARLVVVFSLATAAVLEAVVAPTVGKKMGETTLFRGLLAFFRTGDILLGDRLFAGFRDLAECLRHGVDVVARQHSTRCTDFRRGRWLGTRDHVVTWRRPPFHKDRFTREEWERLPLELQIRELRYRVTQPGFRPEEITIVTTLLDVAVYSAEEIAVLYRERWHCELDIRSLKSSLQMGHLRCKTPGMVEREIWAHLLAYNLIRETAAEAARQHRALPRRLSFHGAVQLINAFATYLPACPQRRELLWKELLAAIATMPVGNRPNRIEPRKLKKRKSKYTYLTRPRNEERRRLCA